MLIDISNAYQSPDEIGITIECLDGRWSNGGYWIMRGVQIRGASADDIVNQANEMVPSTVSSE